MCPVCLQQEAFEYRLTDTSGIARFIWHCRYQGSGPVPKHERDCPLSVLVNPDAMPIEKAKRLEAQALPKESLSAIQVLRRLNYPDDLMIEAINDLLDVQIAGISQSGTGTGTGTSQRQTLATAGLLC